MNADNPKTIFLKAYKPAPYHISSVYLDVFLDPAKTRVTARSKVQINPKHKGRPGALVLDGELLDLEAIRIDGAELSSDSYSVSESALTIKAPPKHVFTLEITTACNPASNKSLSGLYLSKGIFCTQCEAQGFRRITYFLDRPDNLAVFTTRIEADAEAVPVLLSNGNRRERGTLERGARHYAVWHDPHPKPSYLFALVGGHLSAVTSSFRTMSGRNVDLAIYVEPGKENRCGWAMECVKRSMRWDEQRFGREYDLDVFNIVAVSDFNMGAMENKGLNVFNDRLVLASAETATDATYFNIDRVIAHEYFHNWTGNRITCRDWFQLCLKEGLTVFRDQLYCADFRSPAVQRIAEVRNLKAGQFSEDAGPLSHPVRPDRFIEINNFYTMTVYEKGAELCRMLQALLGDDEFRKGMDLYFERHDGEAATVEDFIACFADVSGRNLSQFMRWYSQAGTPKLVCDLKYNAKMKVAELTVEQVLQPTPGQPAKKPLHVPIKLGLLSGNGSDLALEMDRGQGIPNGLVELRKRRETFRFVNVPARPVPSLLRGFSAPVNLTVNLGDADLAFLMAHDSDAFNRWQATQDYATRLLIAAARGKPDREAKKLAAPFIQAFRAIMTDERLEPAFRAQVLTLPSEADIAREIAENIDPSAIHAARSQLRRAIAIRLADEIAAVFVANAVQEAYAPTPEQIGMRSLRNAALALLGARGDAEDVSRAERHFNDAKNLTDESAGLAVLCELRGPERANALRRFEEKWRHDHLVIDTWFAYQAASSIPGTLATVKTLLGHPLMSLENPNKARTLVGVFASNALHFNQLDGKGYAFVESCILKIDRFNPQVAARLLTAFRGWKTLEPNRRALAKATLDRIKASATLSRDVYEIVNRMLD